MPELRPSPVSDLIGARRDRPWSIPVTAAGEGLRERKKRLMRQLISDTATAMFVERGFEGVRVAEVASACGISEKTVYNYFPTKESLVLDREESMAAAIEQAFGPSGARTSPVDNVVGLIVDDVHQIYDEIARHEPPDLGLIRRFGDMFERTPALRAAQQDMMERLVQVAARAMAARAGVDPDDPEPQIAAHAILGLWQVMFHSMRRHSDDRRTPGEACDLVVADVRRAARLIDTGLWSFRLAVQGRHGREQLRAAAESADKARTQVHSAIRAARAAWRQVVDEAHHS